MDNNWAADHLQVIRTLMERSALYRRALAPIMTFAGAVGLVAACVGWFLKIESPSGFAGYWLGVGFVTAVGVCLLVRRQALKESEPFWSLPMRRVVQALLPPFLIGLLAALLTLFCPGWDIIPPWALPAFWMLLYGCALHSAGFFMSRGIKLFGWLIVFCGFVLMVARCFDVAPWWPMTQGHKVMGVVFGGLHLAYGVYLYFTEKNRNVA